MDSCSMYHRHPCRWHVITNINAQGAVTLPDEITYKVSYLIEGFSQEGQLLSAAVHIGNINGRTKTRNLRTIDTQIIPAGWEKSV